MAPSCAGNVHRSEEALKRLKRRYSAM